MLNATAALTLITLLGLTAGFAREWLLVAAWGASSRTDAFLIALFIPDVVRMALATGIMSAALVASFKQLDSSDRSKWLGHQTLHMLILGLFLAVAISWLAPWLVRIIGPGLDERASMTAAHTLAIMSWVLPGLLLQAIFSVIKHSREQFFSVGMGSLLFNMPVVIYLAIARDMSTEAGVAVAMIVGSIVMTFVVTPFVDLKVVTRRLLHWRYVDFIVDIRMFYRAVTPLLASSFASHALTFLERFLSSFLDEGAVTLVNLARKLINLPLVALISLNQVLLSKMANHHDVARALLLRDGIGMMLIVTLPAAFWMMNSAHAFIDLFMPGNVSSSELATLVIWLAVTLVFGSANALMARYHYATNDTLTPLKRELAGSASHALAMLILTYWFGIQGIAMSAIVGVVVTAWLLMRTIRSERIPFAQFVLMIISYMALSGALLPVFSSLMLSAWTSLILTSFVACVLVGMVMLSVNNICAWMLLEKLKSLRNTV